MLPQPSLLEPVSFRLVRPASCSRHRLWQISDLRAQELMIDSLDALPLSTICPRLASLIGTIRTSPHEACNDLAEQVASHLGWLVWERPSPSADRHRGWLVRQAFCAELGSSPHSQLTQWLESLPGPTVAAVDRLMFRIVLVGGNTLVAFIDSPSRNCGCIDNEGRIHPDLQLALLDWASST